MSGRLFVSRFRFVKPNGKVNCLGYIHPDQEVKICFSDDRHESPYTISGWEFAVENQGFRAVAVLTPDDTMSCWTGEPEDVPRWRLQGPGKRISAIKTEFDALKLVSLSRNVPGSESIPEHFDRGEYAWKPDIPPDHVFVSHPDDVVLHGDTPYPLRAIMFGGSRGELLSQLTEILIHRGSGYMHCIEFLYTDSSKNMFIGDPDCALYVYDYSKTSVMIDGPGGERIVEANMTDKGQRDDLLRLQTNRGRGFLLGDANYPASGPWDSITPGSLIIGLFHIDRVPIIRIGVMSINPETNAEAKEAHEED